MIGAYIAITMVVLIFAVMGTIACYLDEDHELMTKISRVALASPVWPVILVYYIFKGLRVLILSALGKYDG